MADFDFADAATPPALRTPRQRPHRAALVLSLGVAACVAWMLLPFQAAARHNPDVAVGATPFLMVTRVLCPILGLAALALGLVELAAINGNRADPRGQGAVLAGTLLGLLAAVLFMTTWTIERAELNRLNQEFRERLKVP